MTLGHLDDSRLQSLADGTLRGPEGFAAREHCDGCVECMATLGMYSTLSTKLSALRDPLVPPDFTALVLAAVDVRSTQLAQRRHTWLAAIPAAAIALFAIVGWALSAAPAAHVDQLIGSATVSRHVFSALVPVLDAARLPLGLGAFGLTFFILLLLSRALRPSGSPSALES